MNRKLPPNVQKRIQATHTNTFESTHDGGAKTTAQRATQRCLRKGHTALLRMLALTNLLFVQK